MYLYDYILQILTNNNKTVNEVLWIGDKNYQILVDEFFQLAMKTLLTPPSRLCDVYPRNVVIAGKDWWLKYDYSDDSGNSLMFCTYPRCPKNIIHITSFNPVDDNPNILDELKKNIISSQNTDLINLYNKLNSVNYDLETLVRYTEYTQNNSNEN
ncbi:unknown [Clostridium sp. CAG:964]|nr:unknown [Clostridium sp. CAG:964]